VDRMQSLEIGTCSRRTRRQEKQEEDSLAFRKHTIESCTRGFISGLLAQAASGHLTFTPACRVNLGWIGYAAA